MPEITVQHNAMHHTDLSYLVSVPLKSQIPSVERNMGQNMFSYSFIVLSSQKADSRSQPVSNPRPIKSSHNSLKGN